MVDSLRLHDALDSNTEAHSQRATRREKQLASVLQTMARSLDHFGQTTHATVIPFNADNLIAMFSTVVRGGASSFNVSNLAQQLEGYANIIEGQS